jgi:PAS domain S-box-containing protein
MDVNAATEEATGYTRAELIGTEFPDYFTDPEQARLIYQDVFRTRSHRNEPLEIRHRDGHVTLVLYNASLYQDEKGQVVGVFAAARDITERRQAEEELLRKTMLLEAQSETSIDGILAVSNEGRAILFNKRFGELFKIPQNILESKDDAKMLECALNQLKDSEEFNGKVRYLYKHHTEKSRDIIECIDGRYLDRYSSPLLSAKGQHLGRIWFFRDITDRKQAEDALLESEIRYRTLFDDAKDGIALADAETGELINCNQSLCLMVEWEKPELVGQHQSILHLPEAVIGGFSHTFKQHKTGDPDLTVEEFLLSKNGKLIPVEIRAAKIRINNRDYLMGIFRDITDRKLAKDELRQSEERYRSIFENVREGIFRSTPEGKILISNQALAKMFGYESPKEMIASVTDIARQLHVDPEARRKIKEMIEEHGFIKGYEFQNYRKDGIIFWISLTMQAVYDAKGQIMYYDGIAEDITNRKQKDERTRKALGATIHAIAVTVETRDPYTAGHQRRVTDLSCAIAKEMNFSVDQIDGISMAASIHDLGKIAVPAEILSKPTKLTNIEFSLIKTHTQAAYDILKDIDFPWPIARIVLEHHERMNGSGYPNGLTGDNILMESRILAVADVVESMASHRPYRPALGIEAALDEIEKNRGSLYDDAVASACLRLFREEGHHLQ